MVTLGRAQSSPLRVNCDDTGPHGDTMRGEGSAEERGQSGEACEVGEACAGPTKLSAFVSSRPEVLEFEYISASLGWQDLKWPCMDLLGFLSVSEKTFLGCPLPWFFLSHLKGQTFAFAQFFIFIFAKRLAIHLFRVFLKGPPL